MTNVPNDADRLLEAGRKKILRTCLLWGIPLLAMLVVAGLHWAGTIRLEEYFVDDPAQTDQVSIWPALTALVLFQFLCWALGVFQGWYAVRRARQLRQQSRPNTSNGVSEKAR